MTISLYELRQSRLKKLSEKLAIEKEIKTITKQILDHPELQIDLPRLANRGGSGIQEGLTVTYAESLSWDQVLLNDARKKIPPEAWPFTTVYKLGKRDFKTYCMEHAQDFAPLIQLAAITKISPHPRLAEKDSGGAS
tara:strand:+ start:720 stop:1130 length:411 start_codon:yes stop_codon:yes gene_type:complete